MARRCSRSPWQGSGAQKQTAYVDTLDDVEIEMWFHDSAERQHRLKAAVQGLTGVDDVGELIGSFQLGELAAISCKRSCFTLVQDGDIVLYRHASTEVRIPRGAYDRLAALVAALIPDGHVQAAFEETTLRLARETRSAAWHPGYIEA